jgi:DNA-binding transcriptional LysR family regulator
MHNKLPAWDDLRMLLAVHRDKSFLAAGRTLGVAASTVARRIEALERAMGRPLVHRGNDGTLLAPDGLRLVALGEELELGLASLRRDAENVDISGSVRLSLSEGFVRAVMPALARLRAKHSMLAVELISESRLADLARREADIGIRIVRSTSPAVVSKALGRAKTGLFAARSYLDRRLPTARLSREAAALHDWVGLDSSLERLPHEQWMREYGARRFMFRSNSNVAIEQAIIAGMGIGLLSEAQGASLSGLVALDLEDSPPPVYVFLAFHREAKRTPRVKAVVRELELEMRRQIG